MSIQERARKICHRGTETLRKNKTGKIRQRRTKIMKAEAWGTQSSGEKSEN